MLQTVMEVGRDNFDILYDVTIKYEMCKEDGTEGAGLPPGLLCEWMVTRELQYIRTYVCVQAHSSLCIRWYL